MPVKDPDTTTSNAVKDIGDMGCREYWILGKQTADHALLSKSWTHQKLAKGHPFNTSPLG